MLLDAIRALAKLKKLAEAEWKPTRSAQSRMLLEVVPLQLDVSKCASTSPQHQALPLQLQAAQLFEASSNCDRSIGHLIIITLHGKERSDYKDDQCDNIIKVAFIILFSFIIISYLSIH
jgi:hypothetical protein